MALAVALILIAVGAVLFHVLSPWWFTPIASNWGLLDDTIDITMLITGVVFVAINLFIAYAIFRFRHREGLKADYQPENKKLEGWLTVVTSLGIVAMLAPGLYVYSDMIAAPPEATEVEALAQQWQWRYRLPGKDGMLGKTDIAFIDAANPFGVDPGDPHARDDLLIAGAALQLPVGRPVKMLLRSTDVLHNFYVPQFRAKMDVVPGLVSQFWFTPTRVGRFEVLCAELCGVGHYNMRSHVDVVDPAAYTAWEAAQLSFAATRTPPPAAAAGEAGESLVDVGARLAQTRGCLACHRTDDQRGIGPGWRDLYGRQETLADGTQVTVDDAYLRESIVAPNARIVRGYPAVMPPADLSDDEVAALIAYIRSLAGSSAGDVAGRP